MKEDDLLAEGPRVEVTNDQARLPPGCNLQSGGCLLDQKTIVWNPPMTKCNLELVRMAEMIQDGEYLIDHEWKVLLKKRCQMPAAPECGVATLWSTEYENNFLTQDSVKWKETGE